MVHLFARWPHAVIATREVADRCQFSLDELAYEYPEENLSRRHDATGVSGGRDLEKQRRVVMGARLMEVRGRVGYDDEVIHVIAQHMTDANYELYRLSDDLLDSPVARADHVS